MAAKKKHGNSTAAIATKLLIDKNIGFVEPTRTQKKKLLIAFAHKNKVIYGKAYDVIKLPKKPVIDLNDEKDIQKHIDKIKIYEIKSTRRDLDKDFKSYFFALTTAELLVAQNLKSQYKFIFVNIKKGFIKELTLQQVLKRARGFYPQWSISF